MPSRLRPPPMLVPIRPPPPRPKPSKPEPPKFLVPTPTQPAPFNPSQPVTPRPPSSGGGGGGSRGRRVSTPTPTTPISTTGPTIANAERIANEQAKSSRNLRLQTIAEGRPITERKVPTPPMGKIDVDRRRLLQRVSTDIRSKSLLQKREQPETLFKRTAEGTLGQFGLGVASGGTAVAIALTDLPTTGRQIAEFTRQFVKSPIKISTEIARDTLTEFVLNPAFTLGEFYSFGKVFRTVAKATQRSPLGRSLAKEMYLIQLPKELRKPARTLINSAESQRLINPVKKVDVKKVGFFDVKELNPVEARALRRTLQQTDSVVFGTASARVLSGQKTRVPADVDLATKNPKVFVRTFINNLPVDKRNLYKIKGAKLFRGNKPIMDIKDFKKLYPNKSLFRKKGELPVSGYVLKLDTKKGSLLPTVKRKGITNAFDIPTSPVVTVKGINFAGFGEQITRKTLGTLQVLIEKNIRRVKDYKDLLQSLKVQVKALEKAKPLNPITKLRNRKALKNMKLAIELLESAKFKKLFEKQANIKSIGSDLTKLRNDLKKAKTPLKKRQIQRKIDSKVKQKNRLKPLKRKLERTKITDVASKSTIRKVRKIQSSIPRSRLPRKRRTRPSVLPSSRVPRSRLPRKSKLKSSRTPSSRTPSSLTPSSRTPSSLTPSSRTPSSLTPSSRTPSGRLLGRKLPPVKEKPTPIRKIQLKDRFPFDTKVKNPKGFNTWIKTRLGWRKANPKPLTRAEAGKLGRYISDNTLSASFVVVGTPNKAINKKVPFDAPKRFFRESKDKRKPKGTKVEKRSFRINTGGEKRGLRASALIAKVRKKLTPKEKKKRKSAKK